MVVLLHVDVKSMPGAAVLFHEMLCLFKVYPGLMLTSGSIHWLLHMLHIPIHIRDICVFLAPIFRLVSNGKI